MYYPSQLPIISTRFPLKPVYSIATANPGESFISPNGSTWEDATTIESTTNVALKAYTSSKNHSDYDGDGIADMAVWRPDTGVWYVLPSGTPGSYYGIQWGMDDDNPISYLSGILLSFP